ATGQAAGASCQEAAPGAEGEGRPPAPHRHPEARAPAAQATPIRGEKGRAESVLTSIRTLKLIEDEKRPATAPETEALARFGGFGPVALTLFPDPVSGRYKGPSWQALGEELKNLLTPEEYESARRTVFNAFYTSPVVIRAMHEALARLGTPSNALV